MSIEEILRDPALRGAFIAVLYALLIIVEVEGGYGPIDPEQKKTGLTLVVVMFILLQIFNFAGFDQLVFQE